MQSTVKHGTPKSPKPYHFVTHWRIEAEPKIVIRAMNDPGLWQKWWPGLESISVIEKTADLIGTKIACRWRSKAGYRLSTEITITGHASDSEVHFESAGDLIGHGSWTVRPAKTSTDVEIIWSVSTNKTWMNLASPLLKPVFKVNHNALMADGERGLNRYTQRLDSTLQNSM